MQAHPWVRFSAVLSYVFVVAVMALLTFALTNKVDNDARARSHEVTAQVISGCNRNNLRAGYSRVRAQTPWEKRAVEAYFQIVDCGATYRAGNAKARTVYLPAALDRCFVALTRRLYWRDHPVTSDRGALAGVCRRNRA